MSTPAVPDPWPPFVPAGRTGPVRIRDVRTIVTAPDGVTLVVVKVLTDEPELYGLGCATFTQRPLAVVAAVEEYLRPLLAGHDACDVEDAWLAGAQSGYWRGGPVLSSALGGIDMALWDIRGKLAGMPVHQLLGGRVRRSATAYVHAFGRDPREVEEHVRRWQEQGFTHVRCQVAVPGRSTYGVHLAPDGGRPARPLRLDPVQAPWDPRAYCRRAVELFEHLRSSLGAEVELVHDVHERIPPASAPALARALEPYGLFFLEDAVAPEDAGHLARLRGATSVPLAFGELLSDVSAFVPLVAGRLVDYVRAHVSTIGGITPARKLAALCELFGVATAWHGPPDASPVAHAANVHLDLASPAFGIQEVAPWSERMREVFPGGPHVRDGALWCDDTPGLGVDLDERLAARHPPPAEPLNGAWPPVRLTDGAVIRP